MSSKKHRRYWLLLDEGVHLPNKYSNLNNLHNLMHVTHVGLEGKSDEKVFKFAKQEDMMMVVFNIKDFKRFIQKSNPSIIALSSNLSDSEADVKICSALKRLKRNEIKGHLISITKSGIRISPPNDID